MIEGAKRILNKLLRREVKILDLYWVHSTWVMFNSHLLNNKGVH